MLGQGDFLDYTQIMTRTLSLEKAAETLPSIVEKLRSGDFVIVQQNGKPVAGIVDVDDMEDFLELQNPLIKKQIDHLALSIFCCIIL